MPRRPRAVIPGLSHHVTHRGNNQRPVFLTDDHRITYLRLLREESERHALRIVAYCLMTNHVHLIVVPPDEHSMAATIRGAHGRYSRAFNGSLAQTGHTWANRHDSCPMDPEHELAALVYVESNPVRAGLVEAAWNYTWSSAAAHCGLVTDDSGLLDVDTWSQRFPPDHWQQALQGDLDPLNELRIRRATRGGVYLAQTA